MVTVRSKSVYEPRPAPLQAEQAQPSQKSSSVGRAGSPAPGAHAAAPVQATPPEALSVPQLQVSTQPAAAHSQLKDNIQKAQGQGLDLTEKTTKPWYSKLLKSEGMLLLGLTVAAASVGVMALPLLCLGAVALLREPQWTPADGQAPPPPDQDHHSPSTSGSGAGLVSHDLMSKMAQAEETHRTHTEHMAQVLDWNGLDITLQQITGKHATQEQTEKAHRALNTLEQRLQEAKSNQEPEVLQAVQWGSFNALETLPVQERGDALARWPAPVLRHALAEAQRLSDVQATVPAAVHASAGELATLVKGALVQRNEPLV